MIHNSKHILIDFSFMSFMVSIIYFHSHDTLIWKWVVGFKNINSFALHRIQWNFREVHLKLFLLIDGTRIPCEIAPRWMALDFTNEKSSLVQVMASCRRVHTFISPCGVRRPQLVKSMVYCKTKVTALLAHWSYCSPAPSHWCVKSTFNSVHQYGTYQMSVSTNLIINP